MDERTPHNPFRLALGLFVIGLGAVACAPEEPDASPMDTTDGAIVAVIGDAAGPDGSTQGVAEAGAPLTDASGGSDPDSAAPSGPLDAALDAGFDGGVTSDASVEPRDAQHSADAAPEAGSDDAASPTNVMPSAGCGKSQRPASGRVSVPGERNYTFPSDYDGKRPFPLLIGFHAASNPIDQIENLTKGSAFERSYVRAFPKSKGTAWDYASDIGKVLAMFDDLLANYCIDTNRVFATGHSSGAQFIVQLLTPARKADADRLKLRAVAPVAASRYGTVSRAIPVLYIQGARDSERRSDGADVVKEFVAANGCTAGTKPFAGPVCMSSGKTVNDGCRQYDGCSAPTLWCSHDDPVYSNTNHGWPCFATRAMADFFGMLP